MFAVYIQDLSEPADRLVEKHATRNEAWLRAKELNQLVMAHAGACGEATPIYYCDELPQQQEERSRT